MSSSSHPGITPICASRSAPNSINLGRVIGPSAGADGTGRNRREVSTTCVSRWDQDSTNVGRVINPSADADGCGFAAAHSGEPLAHRSGLKEEESLRLRLREIGGAASKTFSTSWIGKPEAYRHVRRQSRSASAHRSLLIVQAFVA